MSELKQIEKEGKGRRKEKTTDIGLFKDGFAKTLANCQFVNENVD